MNAQNDATLLLRFPSEKELLITRVFDAPRHLVFAAITQPEHVRNWYGPSYLTLTTCEIDLRLGGKWRYILQAPDGSTHAFSGEYLEIDPPNRLVCTEWYEAIPGAEYIATLTLDEQDGKTTLTNLLRYQSREHRDGHVASGMEGGMRQTYGRLDDLLVEMVAKVSAGQPGATFAIVVNRHFDTSAETVFDAWLDPAALGHWLFATPTGIMKKVEVDARVGGEFLIAEQRGEVLAEHFGRYVEIDRPRRLAFTFAATRRDEPNPSLVTVEIEASGSGCDLRLTQHIDPQWVAFVDRARAGWTMILEGLHNELTADRQIVLTRLFAAPREVVFQAWTDPKHIDLWWGPNGFRNETYEMEVRPGGRWRYMMHGPDGTDYPNRVVYHEVVAPERLVYTHGSDLDNDPDAFHVTVTFATQGEQTLLTMRSLFPTHAQLQSVLAFGAVEGGQQTLARLAGYLETIA